ncbi:hypothetical protein DIPPA_16702 [Diplonema papillatum]|nr:hypothetical protein DIPPA_16702 [Diplonema papillatum]
MAVHTCALCQCDVAEDSGEVQTEEDGVFCGTCWQYMVEAALQHAASTGLQEDAGGGGGSEAHQVSGTVAGSPNGPTTQRLAFGDSESPSVSGWLNRNEQALPNVRTPSPAAQGIVDQGPAPVHLPHQPHAFAAPPAGNWQQHHYHHHHHHHHPPVRTPPQFSHDDQRQPAQRTPAPLDDTPGDPYSPPPASQTPQQHHRHDAPPRSPEYVEAAGFANPEWLSQPPQHPQVGDGVLTAWVDACARLCAAEVDARRGQEEDEETERGVYCNLFSASMLTVAVDDGRPRRSSSSSRRANAVKELREQLSEPHGFTVNDTEVLAAARLYSEFTPPQTSRREAHAAAGDALLRSGLGRRAESLKSHTSAGRHAAIPPTSPPAAGVRKNRVVVPGVDLTQAHALKRLSPDGYYTPAGALDDAALQERGRLLHELRGLERQATVDKLGATSCSGCTDEWSQGGRPAKDTRWVTLSVDQAADDQDGYSSDTTDGHSPADSPTRHAPKRASLSRGGIRSSSLTLIESPRRETSVYREDHTFDRPRGNSDSPLVHNHSPAADAAGYYQVSEERVIVHTHGNGVVLGSERARRLGSPGGAGCEEEQASEEERQREKQRLRDLQQKQYEELQLKHSQQVAEHEKRQREKRDRYQQFQQRYQRRPADDGAPAAEPFRPEPEPSPPPRDEPWRPAAGGGGGGERQEAAPGGGSPPAAAAGKKTVASSRRALARLHLSKIEEAERAALVHDEIAQCIGMMETFDTTVWGLITGYPAASVPREDRQSGERAKSRSRSEPRAKESAHAAWPVLGLTFDRATLRVVGIEASGPGEALGVRFGDKLAAVKVDFTAPLQVKTAAVLDEWVDRDAPELPSCLTLCMQRGMTRQQHLVAGRTPPHAVHLTTPAGNKKIVSKFTHRVTDDPLDVSAPSPPDRTQADTFTPTVKCAATPKARARSKTHHQPPTPSATADEYTTPGAAQRGRNVFRPTNTPHSDEKLGRQRPPDTSAADVPKYGPRSGAAAVFSSRESQRITGPTRSVARSFSQGGGQRGAADENLGCTAGIGRQPQGVSHQEEEGAVGYPRTEVRRSASSGAFPAARRQPPREIPHVPPPAADPVEPPASDDEAAGGQPQPRRDPPYHYVPPAAPQGMPPVAARRAHSASEVAGAGGVVEAGGSPPPPPPPPAACRKAEDGTCTCPACLAVLQWAQRDGNRSSRSERSNSLPPGASMADLSQFPRLSNASPKAVKEFMNGLWQRFGSTSSLERSLSSRVSIRSGSDKA